MAYDSVGHDLLWTVLERYGVLTEMTSVFRMDYKMAAFGFSYGPCRVLSVVWMGATPPASVHTPAAGV